MSEHTHHHHHHHHMDDASRFKRNSLRAIRIRKLVAKWTFRVLVLVAIIMAALVVLMPA